MSKKYKVEWDSVYHNEKTIHGTYDTWQEAMDSIHDWWDKNNYIPPMVRYWTKGGVTTIDYGYHYTFYRIREVEVE